MNIGALGKVYGDGECMIQQGEAGDCMYVVQQGEVEVVLENPDGEIPLSVLKRGDVFGEMSLFTKQPRSATVRCARPVSVRAFRGRFRSRWTTSGRRCG